MRSPYYFLLAGFLACGTPGTEHGDDLPLPPPASLGHAQLNEPADWERLDTVFALMNGVRGLTVVDLHVGDGKLTRQLLEAGANVIAIDTDPARIAALEHMKEAMALPDGRLSTRLTEPGRSGLRKGEAHIAFWVGGYADIVDRPGFFADLLDKLDHPRQFVLVDFARSPTPDGIGTPIEERLGEEKVVNELPGFGFADVLSLSKMLPYRFVVVAQDLAKDDH